MRELPRAGAEQQEDVRRAVARNRIVPRLSSAGRRHARRRRWPLLRVPPVSRLAQRAAPEEGLQHSAVKRFRSRDGVKRFQVSEFQTDLPLSAAISRAVHTRKRGLSLEVLQQH